VLLRYRYDALVESVAVLLRPSARMPEMKGRLALPRVTGGVGHDFYYSVLRVWEEPPERFLSAGLGTLPLAPIARVARADVPAVVREMESRIAAASAADEEESSVWASTLILLGLRYEAAFGREVLKGVRKMRESTTYQDILREEGREEEARSLILRLGRKRFGEPPAAVESGIRAVTDLARLESLADRLLEVESWDDLLAE
jgi:hypothetical protein